MDNSYKKRYRAKDILCKHFLCKILIFKWRLQGKYRCGRVDLSADRIDPSHNSTKQCVVDYKMNDIDLKNAFENCVRVLICI